MRSVILTMGLNHTTAPIQLREQVAELTCSRDDAVGQLHSALDPELFSERLVLSTCNRTEIYGVTLDRDRGLQQMRKLFAGHQAFAFEPKFLYAYADREAIAHLFAVASGIDSMVLGEFEILGQVRRAYLEAAERNSIGPVLHHLFNEAIHVGKRVRSETAIGAGSASVAYAAVALAHQQLGDLAGRCALVVGAGEMGRRTAANLAEDGACAVVVASRTPESAAALANQIGGRAVEYSQVPSALVEADLVICATSAPHVILSADAVARAMADRGGRPLCLIDIAVPRDIDPRAGAVDGVRLFNIDDLNQLVDSSRAERQQALSQVQVIIAQRAAKSWEWYMQRRAAPVISGLHGRADTIREAELNKALRRLGHLNLTERDRDVIAAMSAGIVGKLLAAPTAHLKDRMRSGDGQVYLDTLTELFELTDAHEDDSLPPAI